MPVTTRLLQRLQETLGEEATNDLFIWFDEASAVNRGEVREIADSYFERFKIQLEQGLGGLRGELRVELKSEVARLEIALANQRADLLKWMFIFWAGTIIPLAGLIIALHKA